MNNTILDTGPETGVLLSVFEKALDDIQTKIVDSRGVNFTCFPFGWFQGNTACETHTSPVCVLCRALNKGVWEVNRETR